MRWLLVPFFSLSFALSANADTVTVSAAISLKESLSDIRTAYEKNSGDLVIFNLDASGKLAAQIQQGAPVDLFISADNDQMDKLEKAGQIDRNTRRTIVSNALVLIAPPNEKDVPAGFSDLAKHTSQKLAIGEPKTVPAGRYAMQTLKSLHISNGDSPALLYGESVRQVLSYVEQGDVSAGIVYATDAKEAGDKVRVVAIADPSTHDAIDYPAAVIVGASHADAAKRFLQYLASEPARKTFINRGFSLPGKSATTQKTP